MKKHFIIAFVLLTLFTSGFAQSYNNEWIDYSKTYYKFKLAKTGLHRIPQSLLAAMGIAGADAAHYQLWRNGVQIPLFTTSQAGSIAAGGYIEFWAQANDAKPDSALYRLPEYQLADAKSLYTDSASYFLTVNTAGGNKRLAAVNNTIPAGATPEPYFMYTIQGDMTQSLHRGRVAFGTGSGTLYYASIDHGEGYTTADIGNGASLPTNFTNLFAYTAGAAPNATVVCNLVGNHENPTRNATVSLNGTTLFTENFGAYDYRRLTGTVSAGTLSSNAANFVVANTSTVADRMRVARLDLTYARQFNFGGSSNFRFKLPAKSTGTYLEITNFVYTGTPILYDLNNGRRYEVNTATPAVLKVFLQGTTAEQDLVLVNEDAANVSTVGTYTTRNFINYLSAANQGNFLMIANNILSSSAAGNNPVEDYKNYRSSAAGGGYNAKVYLIDQLEDQFAFGIKSHALSIRNFARFARDKFATANTPRFVVLLGKGVNYYAARFNESNPVLDKQNLIPTFGYPASDVLLTAVGNSSIPLTPIGRISVVSGDELNVYLNKLKEYEQLGVNSSGAIASNIWKKNVDHLVGSNAQGEIDLLYGFLNNVKTVIQDTLYGVKVEDFIKQAITSEQEQNTIRLARTINDGIGLLTFFGHSSSTTLGFNLEDPQNYTNKGKYPLFNMMGCDVGDIFGFTAGRLAAPETVSERYLLAKDRGCIGMMAGTAVGYVSSLEFFYRILGQKISKELYGRPVGEIMQSVIRTTFQQRSEYDYSSNALSITQCEEYVLNGDPAVKLYQQAKPDYAIDDQSITVNPNFISIAETNFSVKAKMYNLGKAVNGKIVVNLKRIYPDQTEAVLRKDTIDAIRYADSLSYTIPINPVTDKGLNKIVITVDAENKVDELFEDNNTFSKEVYIFEDEVRPIYPYNYAIVNTTNIKFSASTADPLASNRNYLFEMDTTALFNSSAKITQAKTSTGGVIEFAPTATYRDSTVYYWRVAMAPAAGEQTKWATVSFMYKSGTGVGFNQSHYYQQQHMAYNRMYLDTDRRMHFDPTSVPINVTTGIFPYAPNATDFMLTINDLPVQSWLLAPFSGTENANSEVLRFYVINNKSMKTWDNVDLGTSGRFGSARPIPAQSHAQPTFFHFKVKTTAERKNVMDFLDSIPKDYYVILVNSPMPPNSLPETWLADTTVYGKGATLYDKLVKEGISILDQIQATSSYSVILQKGKGTPIKQTISQTITQILNESIKLASINNSGSYESSVFGPAKAWNKFLWKGDGGEVNSKDKVTFSILGIDANGGETVVKTIDGYNAVKELDISDVNAVTYPKIKVRAAIADTVNFTPYQTDFIRLYYTPVPEGALAPNLYFNMKDTLLPGEPLNLGIAFKNVSHYNFDSLKVKLTIRDRNNIEHVVNMPNLKPLVAQDTVRLSVPLSSAAYAGSNMAYIEFNPNKAQPEQEQFNNFIYKPFFVVSDSTSPFLDVTFDGVRILNRDIVSSKPNILIKMTDDAKWALLNNPDMIKVNLKYPNGTIRAFNYNNDTLVFNPPAANGDNTASVTFKPALLDDGVYELSVTGTDASGNKAGNIEYRIAFEVINKAMISNMLNYPNPFTTSTAFVFTLTGQEVPQNIRIQILTVTGKIVKEITKAELGPLRIGRNITEYKWDGTDQYGQKLGNGVYLYRVITSLNGKSLDKYSTKDNNTDQYFKKGYGKMYLMR